MPLIKSSSKSAVSQNIREMIKAGHPQKQAVAASLSNQRKVQAQGLAKGGKVDKWIQPAREKMEAKGTVGSLRKIAGAKDGISDSKLSSLKATAKRTGNTKLMKKVTFAQNVRK